MALSDMFGLLGGGSSSDPLDIYGDLFTKEQKAALQQRSMNEGLLRMAGAFGKAAQPSRMPTSFMGALGEAAGAMAGTGDQAAETALKGMQTAEAVRASKQKRELIAKATPIVQALIAAGIDPNSPVGRQALAAAGVPAGAVPAAAATPATPSGAPPPAGAPPPGSGYTGPTNAELGAPPLPPGAPPGSGYAGPTNAELGAPPIAPPGAAPTRGVPGGGAGLPLDSSPPTAAERLEWNQTVGPGKQYLPLEDWVAQRRAGQKQTGLLPPQDQLVGQDGQPLQGPGILPTMNASYGGAPGGRPPFRLASSTLTEGATPGAAGGADILDTVIAPLESGNRNIHQRVTSPNISSAQGYYQITNSTWKDTAPKAGVDLDKFPTAMSAPREIQKQVAQKLYDERGLQPWADFNPAVAAATGYRRGGRFAGAGPDAGRIPAGGGDPMQAISALLQLAGGDKGEDDPLTALTGSTGGGLDTLIPSPGGPAGLPVQQATASLAPYATGNAVLGGPSSVAGVGPDMSGRIERMIQAMPPEVRERFLITSGFRNAQRQAQVNPGVTNSRHMHGVAVDLAKDPTVLNWINQNPQYGLGFPLQADPRETNHLEMIDPGGGRLPIMRAQYTPGGGGGGGGSAAAPAAGGAPGGGYIPGLGITPQGLGALNALLEMGGVDSPFKSVLDTYYKSPGYLGEKTTAETKARTDVEDPINRRMEVLKFGLQMRKDGFIVGEDGKVTEDPDWAKINSRRTEETEKLKAQYQEQLQTRVKDHEEKITIRQEQRADQREIVQVPVYGPNGQVVVQEMPRGERVERLKNQTMTPGPYKPGDIIAKPVGEPPPEHQWQMTPQGELKAMPVPGSPAATKAAEVARTQTMADRTLLRARDIMSEDTARIEQTMKSSLLPVTGFWGSVLSSAPGTPQHDVKVTLDAIKARTSLDSINATRAATGSSGLGQITMGEHTMLSSAVAALEQSQTKEAFLLNLRRVNAEYNNLISSPAFRGTMPATTVVVPPASSGLPPGYTDTGRKYQGKPIIKGPDGKEGVMTD